MKWIIALYFGVFAFNLAETLAISIFPHLDFHKEAQNENFNADELEILKPIIDNLQAQYDKILFIANENENHNANINDKHFADLLLTVLHHFTDEDTIFDETFKYNTNLPIVDKGSFVQGIPSDEAQDMEIILQENIDDAHSTIQSLVDRSRETEALLISINKIKIVKFIYKVLGNIFSLAVRVSRAAYCVYSYIPIINSTLTEGRANIGSCYLYARNSVRHLRSEVQNSIDNIRGNVFEIITIYQKIANRQSLLGKLYTLLTNISKIQNDISDSRSTAYKTIDEVKTEVPIITTTTKDCANHAIPTFVQQLNETITELTTCINFIDDSTEGPEPEPESSEESTEEVDTKFSQRLF